ncbi:hypothetical protein B0H11DRAFT_1925782 [Mycena galericulata]|nr:hypothetical protein B0H11DRAFT_1925782 [Mycena galericulata]
MHCGSQSACVGFNCAQEPLNKFLVYGPQTELNRSTRPDNGAESGVIHGTATFAIKKIYCVQIQALIGMKHQSSDPRSVTIMYHVLDALTVISLNTVQHKGKASIDIVEVAEDNGVTEYI